MARVQMYYVVDSLRYQIKRALRDAVHEEIGDAEFDEDSLYRAFRRAVARKCSTWETVPDSYVETD